MSNSEVLLRGARRPANRPILPALIVYLTLISVACRSEREPAPATAEDTASVAPLDSPPPSPTPGTAALPRGESDAERCALYIQEGLALHATNRAEIRHALGRPDSIEVTAERNRHVPETTDSLVTIVYSGVTFRLRRPGPGGELVENVTVRDSKHLRYAPGVGATEAAVIEALGEPTARAEDELIYACGTGPVDEPVTFRLQNGTVAEVVFAYYVD